MNIITAGTRKITIPNFGPVVPARPTGAAELEIYLSDSFDRANSTTSLGTADSGQVWTALSGIWGIDSNQAYSPSGGDQLLAVLDAGVADGALTIDLTLDSTLNSVDCGVVGRVIDNNNYLLVTFSKTTGTPRLILYKRDAGSFTLLAEDSPSDFAEGGTYATKVIFAGINIQAYVDDVLKIDYDLVGGDATKFSSPTKFGLRVNSDPDARFDNLLFQEYLT